MHSLSKLKPYSIWPGHSATGNRLDELVEEQELRRSPQPLTSAGFVVVRSYMSKKRTMIPTKRPPARGVRGTTGWLAEAVAWVMHAHILDAETAVAMACIASSTNFREAMTTNVAKNFAEGLNQHVYTWWVHMCHTHFLVVEAVVSLLLPRWTPNRRAKGVIAN